MGADCGNALPRWIDGRLLPAERAFVAADDTAFLEGRGCYTTARFAAGRVRHALRHAQRLVRDARLLGIGELDEAGCARALLELGGAAFGAGEGIVRLQASRDARGEPHLVGIPRPLGRLREVWSALAAPFPHPGPSPWSAAKASGQLHHALARDAAREGGADEALLFDAANRLVEGSRSSVFLVQGDGALITPPLARGGVAGIARAIVLERVPEAAERDATRAMLAQAHEIIAVNAVRGALPLRWSEGGSSAAARGGWAVRLRALLEAEP